MPQGGMPVPYAPHGTFEPNTSIADLILRAGQQRAQIQQQIFGQLANTVGQLGEIPGQIARQKALEAQTEREKALTQRAEAQAQREEQRIAQADKAVSEKAKRDQQFLELLSTGEDPDPRKILGLYGPQDGLEMIKGLAAYKEMGRKTGGEALKELPDLVGAYSTLSPEARGAFWPHLRETVLKSGIIQDPTQIPEQRSDEFDAQAIKFAQGLRQKEEKAPSFQHVETAGGIQAFDPTKGTLGPVIGQPKPKEAAPKEPKWTQGEDDQGNPIMYDMASGAVKPFPKGVTPKATGAEANRIASAHAALSASDEIKDYLKKPEVQAEIGPLMGRYNSLLQAFGEGNPTAVRLVGMLKSYSALQPNIHGFRATKFADDINSLLTTKQTPESLLAGIGGIDTAAEVVANRGRGKSKGELTFNPKTGQLE